MSRGPEGHRAKKNFGQNFLHDRTVIDNIVRAIDPRPGERIVEIGPGRGALSFALLKRIDALTAIEIDRDLIPWLKQQDARINIVESDVLKVDFSALAESLGGPIRLVGNLPYNISSPILFHALDHAPVIRDMHFMLQKEVVERMAAGHGNKDYGRLTVMLQSVFAISHLFNVPPGAFTPSPKVDSAIVRLAPLAAGALPAFDEARLEQIVRAAFSMRRKTLRNTLKGVVDEAELVAQGIDPNDRAEQLSVLDFVRLAAGTP
ncbi:MAG: 16S rRNA (adenine(1518)-N(6)/adenine(1519)-N(6))-dimethyltransferase RsmA [Ahniella sp.]|nr:16S rRNA (adenine(1518)-N(6)/adenine(1519)-N(6))-dimethyltransferase RsmA [Ahniella sp.]